MKKTLKRAAAAISVIAIVAATSVPASAAEICGSTTKCNSKSSSNNCGININGCYLDCSDISSLLRSLGLEKILGDYGSCASGNDCNVSVPRTGNGAESDSDSNNNSCDTGDCATAPDNTPSKPDTSIPDDTTSKPDASTPDDTAPKPDTSEPDTSTTAPDTSDDTVSAYEKEVVELVNAERAKYGLPALTLNTELSAVARAKSQDMKDNNYFSHTSPTYGSPFDMMKSFGIKYKTAGENIAKGYKTPEAVVKGWMNSEGHRANILNSSYKEIGVGYVAGGNYWTQMFIG